MDADTATSISYIAQLYTSIETVGLDLLMLEYHTSDAFMAMELELDCFLFVGTQDPPLSLSIVIHNSAFSTVVSFCVSLSACFIALTQVIIKPVLGLASAALAPSLPSPNFHRAAGCLSNHWHRIAFLGAVQ